MARMTALPVKSRRPCEDVTNRILVGCFDGVHRSPFVDRAWPTPTPRHLAHV